MSITIKDIAQIAGVSHSTVSRSLNDSPRVAQSTKDRIKRIAEDVGFEFNANARSLSTTKTNTVAIVYKNDLSHSHHYFSSAMLNMMRRTLAEHDLDTIITSGDSLNANDDHVIRLIQKNKIDGLIVMETGLDQRTMNTIHKVDIPIVFCQYQPEDDNAYDFYCCDHFLGGYEAGKHLLSLQHTHLACIQREDPTQQFMQRTKGFIAALDDKGIPKDNVLLHHAPRSLKGGYTYIMEHIDELIEKNITALFVHTDSQALGIIEGLKELGKKVPTEFSIVGYDDIELGSFYKPHLTTIGQPVDELTLLTCQRLVSLLKNPNHKKQQLFLPPKLVVRESTSALS